MSGSLRSERVVHTRDDTENVEKALHKRCRRSPPGNV